jgi:hypothetical protein
MATDFQGGKAMQVNPGNAGEFGEAKGRRKPQLPCISNAGCLSEAELDRLVFDIAKHIGQRRIAQCGNAAGIQERGYPKAILSGRRRARGYLPTLHVSFLEPLEETSRMRRFRV